MSAAPAPTPLELVEKAAGYFRDRGIESPRLDAEVLLAHALGTTRLGLYLHHDKPLDGGEVSRYRTLVRRRGAGEPTAHLVGAREFWSLRFEVGPDTLIPRPDTERLVEAALETMGERGRFLDLGIGPGTIAVALLAERPGWTAVGVDKSAAAAAFARKNAEALGVGERLAVREGDFYGPVAGERFDLVVSNPPYIPSGEIEGLAVEVARHEPRLALDGGADGLDALRAVIHGAPGHLAPGGRLLVEFGAGQGRAVMELARAAGEWESAELLRDLGGIERVLRAKAA